MEGFRATTFTIFFHTIAHEPP